MLNVLSITLPIFILIGLGYFAVRFGALSSADVRALGEFVLRFLLPALIFKALSSRPFADIANAGYVAAYTLGSLAAFALAFAVARALRPNLPANAIQALGASASNSGFVGYPIAALVVGPTASVALALSMVTENVVMIPLALTLAEIGAHAGAGPGAALRRAAGQLARNPLVIAIVLGGLASLAGLRLPEPAERPIDMLAAAAGPMALVSVGGGLAGARIAGLAPAAIRIAAFKLIVHPALVFAAALVVAPALEPGLEKAMMILASAPMLGVFPLIGRPYGQEPVGAAALLIATAFAFVTISGLLILV